ncbi:MAG: hypothetical protein KF773_31435 [Deltaproteobacteria bacterium]|nr:hypothetical protein [Deltaproteobacteria bacterium]MCW5803476.1 hypothetical protein [Deltaproteobacteria bacterium]
MSSLGDPIRRFPLRQIRAPYILCGAIAALTAVGAIRSGNPALLVVPAVAVVAAFFWTYRAHRWIELRTGGVVLRTLLREHAAPWSQVTVTRHHGGLHARLTIAMSSGATVVEHHLYEAGLDGFFTLKREYRGRARLDELEQALTAARHAA